MLQLSGLRKRGPVIALTWKTFRRAKTTWKSCGKQGHSHSHSHSAVRWTGGGLRGLRGLSRQPLTQAVLGDDWRTSPHRSSPLPLFQILGDTGFLFYLPMFLLLHFLGWQEWLSSPPPQLVWCNIKHLGTNSRLHTTHLWKLFTSKSETS